MKTLHKLRRGRAGFYVYVMASMILSNFAGFQPIMTARAAVTVYKSPTFVSTANSYNDWTNAGNALASDDTYAVETTENDKQGYEDFTFSVPAGASINGFEAQAEAKSSDTSGCQIEVALSWNNGSNFTTMKNSALSGSDAVYTLGGASDNWGHAWSLSEVSDSAFVARISFDDVGNGNDCNSSTVSVDSLQVRVHYTEAVVPATNPTLGTSCGLDIALVLDSSGSVDSTELASMKTAFHGFVNAFLPATPTQFSVTDFDTTASVLQTFTGNTALIDPAIDAPASGGFTNWDDALAKAWSTYDPRPGTVHPNLVVFASDGNPNRVGTTGTTVTEAQAMTAAITQANIIKNAGTRIIALGIGNDLDVANLTAISSAEAVYTSGFDTLAATLADLSNELCGGTITVTKLIDADGNLQTTNDQTPAQDWNFSVAGSPQTTDAQGQTGSVNVLTEQGPFTVSETVNAGYALLDASCVVSNDGNASRGTLDLPNSQVTGIAVGGDEIISCTFINADTCGNGTIEGSERCDGTTGVGEHQTCSESCQLVNLTFCGDLVVQNPNEELVAELCDGNNQVCTTNDGYEGMQSCTNSCTWNSCITQETCGDGEPNGPEECDAGINNGTVCDPAYGNSCNYCDTTCHQQTVTGPYCGDTFVNGAEQCEGDGTQSCVAESGYAGTQSCNANSCELSSCTSTEYCGDTIKNGNEQCDALDGVGDHQTCDACVLVDQTYCGNSVTETPNNEAKDGPQNDGVEDCDGQSGLTNEHYTCSATCVESYVPWCGDGIVNQSSEVCDLDAGVGAHQECNQSCQVIDLTYCGDGAKNGNEECDTDDFGDLSCSTYEFDGGVLSCDLELCTISTGQCTNEPDGPVCGNRVVESGEQCDDGNKQSNDGCSSECTTESLQCTGSRTYTTDADFDSGSLINVNHTPSDQLQLSDQVNAFNFIWVAVSSKGTVVKINTDTGAIVGEYKTAPTSHGNGNPSRTTVDKDGSVWLSNRDNVFDSVGSVIHIGLLENNQCEDRNGNGTIETSTAQNDIKNWTDASGTRNVATADDECIVHYVKIPTASGTRHVSVTSNNDVWVAGYYSRNFDLIKGGRWDVPGSGTIIRSETSVGYGGYGGLIDKNGVIWSAANLLRWDTALPLTGPNGGNWTGYGHSSYGLCIDSKGDVFNPEYGSMVHKIASNGTYLGSFSHGTGAAQGCVVDGNDDLWVAGSLSGNTVDHLKNDGTFVGSVPVGSGPTGVAVDANGKIWATNYYSGTVSRIDPTLNGGIGQVDFTTVNLGGNPYNYSDMTGSTLSGKAQSGTWTVVHDGSNGAFPWKNVSWNASVPQGASVEVTVATSNDGVTFGAPQTITSGQNLSSLTNRYLKVVVSFTRSEAGESPVLYDLSINRDCGQMTDVCPNISGDQESVPGGYILSGGQCIIPSGGGGGGGGGGTISLSVFNEANGDRTDTNANVSWFSNINATCDVVWGSTSQSSVGTPPLYGYSVTTAETTAGGTFHTAVLTGLDPLLTYYWRPVCTGSGLTSTGKELSIAGVQIQGFVATEPILDNPKVLGFKVLPNTGGDLSQYYISVASLISVALLLVYLRRKEER